MVGAMRFGGGYGELDRLVCWLLFLLDLGLCFVGVISFAGSGGIDFRRKTRVKGRRKKRTMEASFAVEALQQEAVDLLARCSFFALTIEN